MLIIRIPVLWVFEERKFSGGVGGGTVAIAGFGGKDLLLVWLA